MHWIETGCKYLHCTILYCDSHRWKNKPGRNLNSGNEWGETMGGLARGGRGAMYTCQSLRDGPRVVCHIRCSTSGRAGSRTTGLAASAQWLYPDDPGRGGRQGEDFHCWFMTRLLFPLPSVLTWSVLLHQPTSISQTPHTRDLAGQAHTPGCHATSLPHSFSTPPLSDSAFFIINISKIYLKNYTLPSPALSLSFACQEFDGTVFEGEAADRR